MSVIDPKIEIKMEEERGPRIKFLNPYEELQEKYDFQTKIIIAVFLIAFLTMLFMVAGLLLDSWHFNSTVYKEYSLKIDTIENLQKTNKELLEQSVQNQKIIVDLQQNVQSLVNKWVIKK